LKWKLKNLIEREKIMQQNFNNLIDNAAITNNPFNLLINNNTFSQPSTPSINAAQQISTNNPSTPNLFQRWGSWLASLLYNIITLNFTIRDTNVNAQAPLVVATPVQPPTAAAPQASAPMTSVVDATENINRALDNSNDPNLVAALINSVLCQ
jgi:hypothetical protein